ncbi:MAG TPA: hypothetical protein VMB50_15090 [Myxococcales bacterium]|nr:hypothetical protein [Myxococcales bacterium]
MRLSNLPQILTVGALAGAAMVLLATCHADTQCYLATDCPANFYCVVDNDGWGHCVAAAEVFGVSEDAGPLPSCTDAGTGAPEADSGFDGGPVDAGFDAGLPDAGRDAGPDAGSEDAGPDAGDAGT